MRTLQTSTPNYFLHLFYKSIYRTTGLLALLEGQGEEECMYYLKNKKHNNKSKSTDDNDNKVFHQKHYNNMHKTVEQYKKQNVELQRQVNGLQQLVGERDEEVRDLAYKNLLPDQILRPQHALQALQDHLTEQHMRQLLGAEPLQAILGAMNKKEENNKPYYIQMIDSIDPVAVLQQEGQEHYSGERIGYCKGTRERRITGETKEKTTTCFRYYDYSPSLPLYSDHLSFSFCVHYIAICCSATTDIMESQKGL